MIDRSITEELKQEFKNKDDQVVNLVDVLLNKAEYLCENYIKKQAFKAEKGFHLTQKSRDKAKDKMTKYKNLDSLLRTFKNSKSLKF